MVQELDREPRPFPPGTSILHVLEEADEELLIPGSPGAGKTTLLLYLTQTLLDQAERDEQQPLFVIRCPHTLNVAPRNNAIVAPHRHIDQILTTTCHPLLLTPYGTFGTELPERIIWTF